MGAVLRRQSRTTTEEKDEVIPRDGQSARPSGAPLMKIVRGAAGFCLLVVRGILLWFLVPLAFLAWLAVHSWLQKSRLKRSLAWYDRNVVVALMKGPFRVLVDAEQPPGFVPLSRMRTYDAHTIGIMDLI